MIQQTQTTMNADIAFFFLSEIEKPNVSGLSSQDAKAWLESDLTTRTTVENVSSPFRRQEYSKIPESAAQETSGSLELSFAKGIESGITREFSYAPVQPLAFPSYDEEDILNWDAVITPPPRPSGTIKVRLKFKGRRKPIPIEDPWEE